MVIDEPALRECGLDKAQLSAQLKTLHEEFGEPLLASLEKEPRLGCLMLNLVCARSALIRMVRGLDGYKKVKDQIIRYPAFSLLEPHGYWFQLTVGCLLATVGESCSFEAEVDGVPKDIVLARECVQLECRSFSHGEAITQAVEGYLDRGNVPSGPASDDTPEVTRELTLMGFMPGMPNQFSFKVNESRRFWQQAIIDKARQMVPGSCNLIACNADRFFRSLQDIQTGMTAILQAYAPPTFSGILAVASHDLYPPLRGSRYSLVVVPNPNAHVPVPADLQAKLHGIFDIRLMP
jgi:hypothetical protein